MRIHPLLALLPCALASAAGAQVVTGRVVRTVDDSPVPEARVRMMPEAGDTVEVAADTAGAFVLRPPAHVRFRLGAAAAGMMAVDPDDRFRLGEGDSLDVVIRLSPDFVVREPLEVVASVRLTPALRAFYARAAENRFGWFLTRREIEARTAVRTTDLLRTAPGVALVPTRGAFGYALRGRGGCVPTVFVDGTRVMEGGNAIDFWTRPEDLEGIEVYTDASVPSQFGGTRATCTVILLWTRIQ